MGREIINCKGGFWPVRKVDGDLGDWNVFYSIQVTHYLLNKESDRFTLVTRVALGEIILQYMNFDLASSLRVRR